ncbi:MAG: cysteine desulfurase family protein [Bacteroidia bacterium]|jgi:cysteine desulfurase
MNFIYLDYNSTAPLRAEVLDAMMPFLTEKFGNPAAKNCAYGRQAAIQLEEARKRVASVFNAAPEELIFTSGATESLNMAIKGIAQNFGAHKRHILASPTEHKAVLATLEFLKNYGFTVEMLPVDTNGLPDLEYLDRKIHSETLMVCIMHANNETGVIHPVEGIKAIMKSKDCFWISDTCASAGKMQVDFNELGADFCALSAHKFGGPKGIGLLYIKKKKGKPSLPPLIHGGGQEFNIRSGTVNVAGAVGLASAIELAISELEDSHKHLTQLRNQLEFDLQNLGAQIIGKQNLRLSNTTFFRIPEIPASKTIKKLTGISVSTGSACHSGNNEPSHVALALGYSKKEAQECIRISMGHETTIKEVGQVARLLSLKTE